MYSVDKLRQMSFDKHSKPYQFHHDLTAEPVDNWTDLSVKFVKWLTQNQFLTSKKLPVPNNAKRGKYFINDKPVHKDPQMNGEWKKVNGFFVDTKYNADAHIKNILCALQYLSVPHELLGISIHYE